MNLIVAVDENWAIGNRGQLLVSIPADHKRFRQQTVGKVVVLGRKTLETFPQQQPLAKRENIILTGNPDLEVKGATMAHSVEEVLELVKAYATEDVFIIGGDSVYKQFLPYCDTAYVTKIDHAYEADAFFPNLAEDPAWEMAEESEEQTYFDLEYYFQKYVRK